MASAASKRLLKQLPSDEAMEDIILRLSENTDQALAVTGAAYLDHVLQLLLQAFFRNLNSEENTRMFDGAAGGILGSFAAKIRIAYAASLVAPQTYRDLLLLNDIRNVFAHTLHEIDFENELVAEDCAKLKTFKGGVLWLLQETPKTRYAINILVIYKGLRQNVQDHLKAKAIGAANPWRSPSPDR